MDHHPILSSSNELLRLGTTDQLSTGWAKDTRRALEPIYRGTIVGAARAEAVGYVAATQIGVAEFAVHCGMESLNRLHQHESAVTRNDPIQAERVSGYIEDFMMVSRHVIRDLPRRW